MRKKPTVDGFVLRRSSDRAGGLSAPKKQPELPESANLSQRRTASQIKENRGDGGLVKTSEGVIERTGQPVVRSDIDDSLREIDSAERQNSQKDQKKSRPIVKNRKKAIKLAIISLLIVGGLITGWLGVKAILASNSVFKGDVFGLLQHKELKKDKGGRTNVLVFGTSEDDPGHEGASLTDSIMVISVDQTKKDAYMVSIPRDLPVKYGMACPAGYSGKINAYYSCIDDDFDSAKAEEERQTEMRRFVGDILGIDIQYSVHVNYTVVRDVVNALGGITVTIESEDPRGQMDANFDWKCGDTYAKRIKNCPPRGHFIDYPNGPVNLDAEHALYLAQARGDIENWGFSRSNFDREQNQQKIIKATREKALSTGTLANPIKVSGLIDAIGNNLRTNFATNELGTLMSLAKEIPDNKIIGLDLQKDGIMQGDAVPTSGMFNFSGLQAYIQKKLYATGITRESAHIVVLNGSGQVGVAQREATKLEALGMEIDAYDNAPDGVDQTNVIYQLKASTNKPETVNKLKTLYGAKLVVGKQPLVPVADTTDFVIVIVKPPVDSQAGRAEGN